MTFDFSDGAAGEPLRDLIAWAREGWVVDDSSGERGRDGHDRSAGAELAGLARDDDSRRVLGDRPDRPLEADRVAQACGESRGRFLQPAHEPVLRRPALRAHERVPTAAGAHVEEHVEEGQAGGLGREDVRHGRRKHGVRPGAFERLVEPRLQCHRVKRARLGRRPGAVERDACRHPLERRHGRAVLLQVVRVVALVAVYPQRPAILKNHVVAGGPLRKVATSVSAASA